MSPGPEPCESKKKSVDLHYEEQWERYSDEDVSKRVNNLSPVLDAIISDLVVKPGSKILDLGCGPAILPLRFCELHEDVEDIQVYGIDLSWPSLHLGKRVVESKGLGKNIHLIKGDCEALPFRDNCFDNIISNATINLLLDKNKGFKEIGRVTKEGGMVVVGDCTAQKGKKCSSENNDNLWSACISGAPTKAEFETLAHEAGLEMIQTIDMSKEVTRLVKEELWDWPEFTEYGMGYHVFVMRKE